MKAAVWGLLLGLAALAACERRESEVQKIAAAARAKASAAAAARSADEAEAEAAHRAALARVGSARPARQWIEPPAAPTTSSQARVWLAASASSAEIESQIWAILEGQQPPGGLPSETYDPGLDKPPPLVIYETTAPPRMTVRHGEFTAKGGISLEASRTVVRQRFGFFRLCYENGLKHDPKLTGKVRVSLKVDQNGKASSVEARSADLKSSSMLRCIERALRDESFPRPEEKQATVAFTLTLAPG